MPPRVVFEESEAVGACVPYIRERKMENALVLVLVLMLYWTRSSVSNINSTDSPVCSLLVVPVRVYGLLALYMIHQSRLKGVK